MSIQRFNFDDVCMILFINNLSLFEVFLGISKCLGAALKLLTGGVDKHCDGGLFSSVTSSNGGEFFFLLLNFFGAP